MEPIKPRRHAHMTKTLVACAALTVTSSLVAACGDSTPSPAHPAQAIPTEPTPHGTTTAIVIKTNLTPAQATITDESNVGGKPFCPGGVAKDQHGNPQIGLVDRTITCEDGTIHMGFDPQTPKGNSQSGPWRIVSGTGAYEGWTGTGQMTVAYDPQTDGTHPADGHETFTGTIST
jgi:hypothetical protein